MTSLNTIASIPYEYENQRFIPMDQIEVTHEYLTITDIRKKPIEKTNDLKFYKIFIEFSNGKTREFIVPSFVKFYSSHTGTFVPVERIRSRVILMDYAGNAVKVNDAELVEDFKMTDYYNIKVQYDSEKSFDDSDRLAQCTTNFYMNGVLANVSYNNFQIRETFEDSED